MKITAEFNSNEELLSFISTFGAKTFIPSYGIAETPKRSKTEPVKKEESKEVPKDDTEITEVVQLHSPDKEETNGASAAPEDKSEKVEDTESKVTKEMVRERLGIIMKSGKQKEVKELVAKYGASKVPDLKEEDYAAVYKEAEALL